MKRYFQYENMATAYADLLHHLLEYPEYVVSPRGSKIHEITNVVIEVSNPNMNLYTNPRRSSPLKYIAAEIEWYFSGSNTIEFISQYASMWKELQNPNGTVNSAYGYLLFKEKNPTGFTQYEWALESLKRDKDTRQAFLHFNNSSHQHFGNKDQVCTMYGIFQIRDNRLNFTVHMRSNDVVLGFMTDFVFFNVLHQQMLRHLSSTYPELRMGTYTHTSNSMHLYEQHFELVREMLNSPILPAALPLLDCDLIHSTGAKVITPQIQASKFRAQILNTCYGNNVKN